MENDQSDDDLTISEIFEEAGKFGRGKGRIDREKQREDRQNQAAVLRAIKTCNPHLLTQILKKSGLNESDAGWKNAWKAFYAFCRK